MKLKRKVKNMIPYRTPLVVAALITSAGTALASEGIAIDVSGFGTLGGVVTSSDEVEYRQSLRQSHGASKSADFGVDSRLGVQANVKFNDTLSGVGQVLFSRRLDGDGPFVEWLYGQAQLPAGFSLKLGRIVLPQFMLSDSLSVGISQHWLRAPADVYAAYPSSSFDGGQLQYRASYSSVNFTAQLSKGKAKSDMKVSGITTPGDIPDIVSLNLLAETGDWLLRYGQSRAKDIVFSGLGVVVTDDFRGLGLQFDNGKALLMAEYVTRRQPAGVFDSDGMYVSAGWRLGTVLPYLTYSKFKPKGVGYGPAAEAEDTTAAGVKWDVAKNIALKAQVDHTLSTTNTFVNPTSRFAANPYKINVYSVAVDFAF